ncbi:MAG: HDOD domain-containing protein [Thermomicrobium sp.]|nr:HDOD domain-containing protein [Thermomicrobium sp.]
MYQVAIARQPIFDRHLETVAYELRYGQLHAVRAGLDEEAARFLAALLDIGLETLVGSRQAVLTVPPGLVVGTLPELLLALPADRLILVVDPAVRHDTTLRAAYERLAARGCRLLCELPDDARELPPFLDSCELVRLRLPRNSEGARRTGWLDRWLAERLAQVAPYRSVSLQVLVTDVRDYRAFARARDHGADLFQGDFLFRPVLVHGKRHPVSQAALVLLARVTDPAVEFEEVERLLAQDVDLTYKLLKLVNTVWFARRSRIESLRQALLVLGLRNVAAWVAVLVLAGVERKPVELVRTALVRAHMCELLAGALGLATRDAAFLAGLLSVLDAALDLPLAQAIAALPLASDVEAALLERSGPLGRILQAVLAYERGSWEDIPELALSPELLLEAYIDALACTADVLAALDVTV